MTSLECKGLLSIVLLVRQNKIDFWYVCCCKSIFVGFSILSVYRLIKNVFALVIFFPIFFSIIHVWISLFICLVSSGLYIRRILGLWFTVLITFISTELFDLNSLVQLSDSFTKRSSPPPVLSLLWNLKRLHVRATCRCSPWY